MNFSAPLNFPMSFNHSHVYYPQSHPYPQQSDQIPISKLLPKEVQRPPHQEALYNQLWVDDQNLIKYDPVKKIKDSGGYGVEVDHPPGLFLNPAHRSETIKNKNMTSSFHTGCVSGLNYLDQRIPPNQKPGLNKVLNPRSEPKPAFETEPDNCISVNPRALPGYDNRFAMHPMATGAVHANSIREWPANFPQQFSSNQMPSSVNQFNLLQNLQLQMANSQKAYEMMMAKGMNPLMQGQMNYNVQQLNAYRQAQNEQLALAMAFNAQNQLRLEQEAQRKQVELAVTSSMPVKEQPSMLLSSKTQIEPMMFDDFPEIPLDHSFFPDLYMLGNDSPFENPTSEDFKAKDFDDSDDKKTAATSVSTSHMEDGISKEVSNFYNFDFQPFNENLKQASKKDMQQVNPKKQQQKFLNPDRQKKEAESMSLLKKRDFEVFENGGKNLKKDKTDENNKEKKKTINPKIQVTGVPRQRISDDILHLTGFPVQKSPIGDDKMFHSLGININMHEAGFKVQDLLKPVSNVDKLKKARNASPASSSKEIRPIKKERKLNKLSEDLETKQEELKKLYSFPVQPETKDPEQKIEKTRVGRAYQVPVRAFDFTRIPEKKERTIKSVWNPSLIESEKIQEFFTQLKEIFGQEVKKEEAALKILRGTGMDVDSTVDILRRNTLYFKAILFPEPKPEKTKRSYWAS